MGETIESARPVIRAARILAAHPLDGIGNIEMAQALGLTPPRVTKIMDTLVAEGWAERTETGRFRPTIIFVAMATAAQRELDRVIHRAAERQQRINAASMGN